MKLLTIMTLNMYSFRMGLSRCQVISFLLERVYSVLFLQENRATLASKANLQLVWGDTVHFSHLMETLCRLAALFSLCLQPEILQAIDVVPGYLLHFWIQIQELDLNLLNIYISVHYLEMA